MNLRQREAKWWARGVCVRASVRVYDRMRRIAHRNGEARAALFPSARML